MLCHLDLLNAKTDSKMSRLIVDFDRNLKYAEMEEQRNRLLLKTLANDDLILIFNCCLETVVCRCTQGCFVQEACRTRGLHSATWWFRTSQCTKSIIEDTFSFNTLYVREWETQALDRIAR